MFIDEKRVGDFMSGLSSGMQPASWESIAGLVVFTALVLLVWMLVSKRRAGRHRATELERSRRIFRGEAARLDLAPSERDLLEEIAQFLHDPEAERHLLLTRKDVFLRAMGAFAELERAEAQAVAGNEPRRVLDALALKVRLGFHQRSAGQQVRSSAEIPPGAELRLPDGRPLARVIQVSPGSVEASLLDGASEAPAEGEPITLHFQRSDGRYELDTTLLVRRDRWLVFQHNPVVRRREGRAAFRLPVRLAARINRTPCETIDLSGGGVCLAVSRSDLQPGDPAGLDLDIPGADGKPERLTIGALVVSSEPEAGLLRLQFEHIREGDRDRIFQYLFRRQRETDSRDEASE